MNRVANRGAQCARLLRPLLHYSVRYGDFKLSHHAFEGKQRMESARRNDGREYKKNC